MQKGHQNDHSLPKYSVLAIGRTKIQLIVPLIPQIFSSFVVDPNYGGSNFPPEVKG